jgi:hypothetical protein
LFFASCDKYDVVTVLGECTREINNAAVKAIIKTYKQNFDGKSYWLEYELVSVKYENSDFKLNELNFPETVPDEYLETVQTVSNYLFPIPENEGISDNQSKIGLVNIYANNSAGNFNGGFYLLSDQSFAEYIYADRSFIMKGSDKYGNVIDCSFEKGWNVMYSYNYNSQGKYTTYTTQKPLNEDFRWRFNALCPD